MAWLGRLGGVAAALLGIVGIVACLVGIAWVWNVRGRVDDAVAGISVRIDDALERVEGLANQTTEHINGAQESVRELNDRVRERVAKRRDVPPEKAAGIDELERRLYARVRLISDWIGFIRSAMDLVEQLVRVVDSASLFAKSDAHTMRDVIVALRDEKKEIEHASALLDDVTTCLADIRAHRNLDESAKRIRTLSSMIDTSLATTRRYAEGFQRAVADLRTNLTDLATRIRRQTLIGQRHFGRC